MEDKKTSLSAKVWMVFVIYGLIGQIAWTIENMYLNVYIYKTVTYNPDAIALMVALSAIVATVTTLAMGAVSDKLGKRKMFMSIGYIIWGISIVLFGFITPEAVKSIFPNSNVIALTVGLIIFLDCLMTFLGSTANDAAFNSWVTDVTNPTNRGKVEGVLSAMPLLGMLVVFGLLDGLTQNGEWKWFFGIVGFVVFVAGIVGLFLIKDKEGMKRQDKYFRGIGESFKEMGKKRTVSLLLVFISMLVVGIAQQIFMPYFIIYFEFYLGITDYALILGAILILASLVSVFGGRLVDKKGKNKFLIGGAIGYGAGMVLLFMIGLTLKDNTMLTIIFSVVFGTIMMGAYLIVSLILSALNRDLVPKTHVGGFNGIRMIFYVMLPMIIGPFIGSAVIKNGPTYVDEYGATQYIPTPYIFLASAIAAFLAIIPIIFVIRNNKEGKKQNSVLEEQKNV